MGKCVGFYLEARLQKRPVNGVLIPEKMKTSYREVMNELKSLSSEKALAGMARFGIKTENAYGISITTLRKIQHSIRMDDKLARRLWSSRMHEARLLGSMIADPEKLTAKDVESIVKRFDSWDLVDEYCLNLFTKSALGYSMAFRYSGREPEFEKRTGYASIAVYAGYHKNVPNARFEKFFPLIIKGSTDERDFVRKAVNWALRQIGKRNMKLNAKALAVARSIRKIDNRTARWIAADAIKELTNPKVLKRLRSM